MTIILISIGALVVGAALGHYLPSAKLEGTFKGTQELEKAREEAKAILEKVKSSIHYRKELSKKEEQALEESWEKIEETLSEKESLLKRREDRNRGISSHAEELKKEINLRTAQLTELATSLLTVLEQAGGQKKEQVVEFCKDELEKLITEGKEKRHQAFLEDYAEDSVRHAKAVLQVVIQRLGVGTSVDKNSTALPVKDERFKGMLIGKEAKNILYLEELLPVHVIFNHGGDPKLIYVTGVNLIRRNIAKEAILKLQHWVKKTGGIDQELIKKAVDEAERDIMTICNKKGAEAIARVGLDPKETPEEILNLMGRLYFRTSYGQNQMLHSIEAGYAARIIAEIIGVDVQKAQTAAFYHDLGKSIDHDTGGSHDEISAEILGRYNYDEEIVYATYCHHGKGPDKTPTDYIVKAADAISGARPGARMESVTNYFERMKELEDLAGGFKGVKKVFTMAAGREVRILVDKEAIKDNDMGGLAGGIAQKISDEVAFPGIIKVNVIRQTKSTDYAREKMRNK